MHGNVVETIIGAVVLITAILFMTYAYRMAGGGTQQGYEVVANFDRVDGLALGADVRLSGIKIGTVTEMSLNPESYEAHVKMIIQSDIELYEDTSAKITSAGIFGSQYISLDPGGGGERLHNGDEISYVSGSVDLIGLISRFIFSGGGEPAQ